MTTPPNIAALAGSLTGAQRDALAHGNAGGCAYRWAKRGTLEALNARGLVGRKSGLGSMFSPATSIEYPLTPLGLAVRAILKEQSHDGQG